jgi:hypothetical protein
MQRLACYLAEWYRPDFTEEQLDRTATMLENCAVAMSAEGSPVRLLVTLAVPTDEVIFGVFAASSAQIVNQACQRAGIPAQRLTAAIDARITPPIVRETPDSPPAATP